VVAVVVLAVAEQIHQHQESHVLANMLAICLVGLVASPPPTSVGGNGTVNLVYPKILISGMPLKQFVRPAMSSVVRGLPCQLILP
jgi:hypothetical protein